MWLAEAAHPYKLHDTKLKFVEEVLLASPLVFIPNRTFLGHPFPLLPN